MTDIAGVTGSKAWQGGLRFIGLFFFCHCALAQNYPVKPVRYIMPSTGASELVGRLIAQAMSEVLGQQVYVDVRSGAGGNLGAELAAKAPADD